MNNRQFITLTAALALLLVASMPPASDNEAGSVVRGKNSPGICSAELAISGVFRGPEAGEIPARSDFDNTDGTSGNHWLIKRNVSSKLRIFTDVSSVTLEGGHALAAPGFIVRHGNIIIQAHYVYRFTGLSPPNQA